MLEGTLLVVALLLTALAAASALYYLVLAFVGASSKVSARGAPRDAQHRFAILIPAHNEEETILAAIDSCEHQVYPQTRYRVFVVADNCSDRTVELAETRSALCLRRRDPERPGKGHALRWALEVIEPMGFDAVVVLDADCSLQPTALRWFDRYLSRGSEAIQARSLASNALSTPISFALSLGTRLESDFLLVPKSRLGLAVFLQGTGMVLRSSLLERIPWTATGIAEDLEYSLELLRAGVKIDMAPEVEVASMFPETFAQLRAQRSRWAEGGLSSARRRALGFILRGIAKLSPRLVDAGWSLLTMSRALLVLEFALAGAAIVALVQVTSPTIPIALAGVLLGSALAHVVCLLLALVREGLSSRHLRLCVSLPLVALELVAVTLSRLFSRPDGDWVRTPRS